MTIPSGYGQVSVEYSGPGAPTGAVNVFGIADPGSTTPAAIAATVRSIWGTRIMPNLTDDVVLSKVRVKLGPDDTGAFGEVSAATGGSLAVTSLTPNTAFLVNKGTELGGRRGRGRMFIPGVAEGDADDSGTVLGSRLAALNTALTQTLDDLALNSIAMYLLHSPATVWVLNSDGQPRRQPLDLPIPDPDLVLSLSAAAKVATQRRRLRR